VGSILSDSNIETLADAVRSQRGTRRSESVLPADKPPRSRAMNATRQHPVPAVELVVFDPVAV
jgi:hypothetical protein